MMPYENDDDSAVRALEATEQRYASLFGLNPDPIGMLDVEGRIVSGNAALERLLGEDPGELLGRPFVQCLAEDQRADAWHHFERALAGVAQTYEVTGSSSDGRSFTVVMTHIPVVVDGAVEGVYAIAHDVTARRAVEAQLMQMQKLEALGRLARGVAHDFNNALTVIGGHAELLTSSLPDGSEDRQNAEHIRGAALRAAALTRQLLAYGRGEDRDVRVCDLNALLLELQPMLATLLSDEIVLSLELAPDLAGINAEPAAIEQTVMNLVVNARDAMPGGGRLTLVTENVHLADGEHAMLQPGRYASLTVSDTGCGMAPDIVPHIFEPFFTTKPATIGTGLGLSMAHTIIQQAGGSITVDTAPGAGTTFRILLPGRDLPARKTAREVVAPTARLDGSETILIAEDDPGVRALVVATLERYGYRVMAAVDGMQALELFRMYGHLIDMIVTDVNMPELKGPELVRILSNAGTAMPVLYISAFTPESLQLEGLAARRAFLSKPFTPIELANAVRQLLSAAAP